MDRKRSELKLSLTQQDIYFEQLRFPNTPMFNIGGYICFGAIDADAMIKSHMALVGSHDVFGIRVLDGKQFISKDRDLTLPLLDLSDEHDPKSMALAKIESEMRTSFNLNGEFGLFRALLFKLSDTCYWYMGMAHHLICDGVGFANWARCLGEIYCGHHREQAMSWQAKIESDRAYLESKRYKKSEDYWFSYCKGSVGSFLKPYYQVGDSSQEILRSRRSTYLLSVEEEQTFNRMVESQSLNKAAVLSAILGVYCKHVWAREQILLGLPAHNRQNYAQKQAIGLFASVLPLKVDMVQPLSFVKLARAITDEQRKNFRHSGYPLGHLRRALGLTHQERLYDIAFSYLKTDSQLKLESGEGTLVYVSHDHEMTPLMLTAWEYGEGLPMEFQLDFNLNYFTEAEADLLFKRLRYLLLQVSLEPSTSVSKLEIINLEEQEQLRQAALAPLANHGLRRIEEAFACQVTNNPNSIAIICDDRQLSYNQLDIDANRIAAALQERGVKPGQAVALFGRRSINILTAILGVLKAGAYYLPLDPDDPKYRIEFIIDDAKPFLVLADECCEWQTYPASEQWVGINELLKGEHGLKATFVPQENKNDNPPAYITYTSGTTGQPKGVVVGHLGVLRLVLEPWFVSLDQHTRTLLASPLAFDAAIFEIYSAWLNGGTLIVYPDASIDMEKLNEIICRHRVNTMWLTSGLFNLWSQDIPQLNELKYILTGGDIVSPQAVGRVYKQLTNVTVVNGYGPTENTTFSCCYPVPRGFKEALPIPIGFSVNGTETRVVDENDKQVPYGLEGELLVAGDGVAIEYLNQPELTANKFSHLADSDKVWYRTGDIVRHQADGSLVFIGRRDGQIKIRGYRIEVNEVEQKIAQMASVKAAVVVAHGEHNDKELVAYLEADDVLDDNELLKIKLGLSKQLPRFMVPHRYIPLTEWPLSANGKIDRHKLPDPGSDGYLGQTYVAPASDLERTLCAIIQDVTGNPQLGIYNNFFESGVNSLLVPVIQSQIESDTGFKISVTDFFEYPTVSQLVQFISSLAGGDFLTAPQSESARTISGDIAVIGLAGRFPGADSPDELWHLVSEGREVMETFSPQTLLDAGISEESLSHPEYVKSGALLKGLDLFDAKFFNMTPREVQLLDPQERMLLESAVQATEDAGYGDKSHRRNIGVFVGIGDSIYHRKHVEPRVEYANEVKMGVEHALAASFAATRIAYRLNLSGPAVNIATACSTSLVSVHQACNSLRMGECDMALAGGALICQLEPSGYQYQEGSIFSKDGHCYAFDERACGTRGGNGAGLVLLKPLEQALADRDPIRAVIKGSAINNDGDEKVSYHAPGINGQSAVIRSALDNAGLNADSIGYIETHGTGTALGDPIEVRALTKAYGLKPGNKVALGTLKPNIGHLDVAAGIAGLIKLVKLVEAGKLPPAVNFARANPAIEFSKTPFYVNTNLREWPQSKFPRRGAVSAFGIGGTNAHVIVEQAPELASSKRDLPQLLVLSANSAAALKDQSDELADFLVKHDDINLVDCAYTLQVGRSHRNWRIAMVCDDIEDAQRKLAEIGAITELSDNKPAFDHVVLMFSGQGSQYIGMASGLYKQCSTFTHVLDACAEHFQSQAGYDIRDFILAREPKPDSGLSLTDTEVAQPVLFSLEYALAIQLRDWGVRPDVLIGHSLGELVAACVAGVFSLADAARIINARSRLMQACEPGSMMVVELSENQLLEMIEGSDLELAAVNAPNSCVVGGCIKAVEAFKKRLTEQDINCSLLHTSRAFHSSMMEPVLDEFAEQLRSVTLNAPSVPIISNVTGRPMTADQATSVNYWCQQLRSPVRFSKGIDWLMTGHELVPGTKCFVEVGPGQTLISLARKVSSHHNNVFVQTLPHAKANEPDLHALLHGLGHYWRAGGKLNWDEVHGDHRPHRVSLPTYPFERRRHWLEPVRDKGQLIGRNGKLHDSARWLYQPQWQLAPGVKSASVSDNEHPWLVFDSQAMPASDIFSTSSFVSHCRVLVDDKNKDPLELVVDLVDKGFTHLSVLYSWMLDATSPEQSMESACWFGEWIKAAGLAGLCLDVHILTKSATRVTGGEQILPDQALISGLAKVAGQEFDSVDCRLIDIDSPTMEVVSQGLLDFTTELTRLNAGFETAWRFGQRWQRQFVNLVDNNQDTAPLSLHMGGHYLITGGLGRVGLILAEHLARRYQAKISLLSRSQPSLAAIMADPALKSIAIKLRAIEDHGGKVTVVQADIADLQDTKQAIATVEAQFGPVLGVIHAAADVNASISPISDFSASRLAGQCRSKVDGSRVIAHVFADKELDFVLLMSSLSVQLGGIGYGAYASANAWLDAFAQQQHNLGSHHWMAVNWDGWDVMEDTPAGFEGYQFSMQPKEGIKVFDRVIGHGGHPCLVNSTGDLAERLQAPIDTPADRVQSDTQPNQERVLAVKVPSNKIEAYLVGLWQEVLGHEVISIDDNFFDLGGDSLSAIRVFNALKKQYCVDDLGVGISDFFASPVITDVAKLLTDKINQKTHTEKKQVLEERGEIIEEGEF